MSGGKGKDPEAAKKSIETVIAMQDRINRMSFGCTPHASRLRSGSRYSHCGACHLDFSGLTAFDKHRRGPHEARYCVDPALDDGRTREGRPIADWWMDGRGLWHEGPRYEYEKKEET